MPQEAQSTEGENEGEATTCEGHHELPQVALLQMLRAFVELGELRQRGVVVLLHVGWWINAGLFRGHKHALALPKGVTTLRGAFGPRAPRLPSAVLFRSMASVVTYADLLQRILLAAFPTISGVLLDVAEAPFHATTFGASTPLMPISKFAIEWLSTATASITFADLLECLVARLTTAHRHRQDFAIPKLLTAATLCIAN